MRPRRTNPPARIDLHLRDVRDPDVLRVMGEVPRDRFVPPELATRAHDDSPLPIGCGQTISQPYIVAAMSELLQLPPGAVVLEVGTGSGYQAAVLSRLAARVYSVERIPELAERARRCLHDLGYDNVEVTVGDGAAGRPEQAPFDGIMVTAAAPRIPPALVDQLKPGRRLVIPVGPPDTVQRLVVVEKDEGGRALEREVMAVRFVPLL